MKVAVFSTKPYDRQFLDAANTKGVHKLRYLEPRLSAETAQLAQGADAVCAFANDDVGNGVLEQLTDCGVRLVVLRATGFNNVDLSAARAHGVAVGRVPAYSPNSVAEHTFALILSLVRKIHRSYSRVREGNFSLDGLLGFNLAGKTVGIVGVGAIGCIVARIAIGFGCKVLAVDPIRRSECEATGVEYVWLEELLARADLVTLHCPLDRATRHLIDAEALDRMKPSAILVNTSRGAVIDTQAVIGALKRQRLAGLAIDVYEEEENFFFDDHSASAILDDSFARLLTFPNVLVTGHQGFFTVEALTNIAETTIANLDAFEKSGRPVHCVELPPTVESQPQRELSCSE